MVESVTVTSRMDKATRSSLEVEAAKQHIKLSKFVAGILADRAAFSTLNSETAQQYIGDVQDYFFEKTHLKKLPPEVVIHLCVMNYLALNEAEMEVYGNLQILEPHYIFDRKTAELLTGDRLQQYLKDRYVKKLRGQNIEQMEPVFEEDGD